MESSYISTINYYGDIPDKAQVELRTPMKNRDNVYLIHCVNTKFYKIGHTLNVIKRLALFQTGNHHELRLVACCNGGANFESILHNQYRENVATREWFTFDDSKIIEVVKTFWKKRESKQARISPKKQIANHPSRIVSHVCVCENTKGAPKLRALLKSINENIYEKLEITYCRSNKHIINYDSIIMQFVNGDYHNYLAGELYTEIFGYLYTKCNNRDQVIKCLFTNRDIQIKAKGIYSLILDDSDILNYIIKNKSFGVFCDLISTLPKNELYAKYLVILCLLDKNVMIHIDNRELDYIAIWRTYLTYNHKTKSVRDRLQLKELLILYRIFVVEKCYDPLNIDIKRNISLFGRLNQKV